MKPTAFRRLALATISIFIATGAYGSDFRVFKYSKDAYEAAPIVAQHITPEFIKRFPASKYTIVIQSNASMFGSGHLVGVAFVGVAPTVAGVKTAPVPGYRFAVTKLAEGGDPAAIERAAVHDALARMMENLVEVQN